MLVTWNGGARRLYGYSAEEAIGRSASFLITADLPDVLSGILAKIRRGETIEHHETIRVRKDGKRLDVSFTFSPIDDGHGGVTGIAGIARDITKAKQSQAELKRANEELEQFAYVASRRIQLSKRHLRHRQELPDSVGGVSAFRYLLAASVLSRTLAKGDSTTLVVLRCCQCSWG